MPLTDTEIKKAKPLDKAYKLFDGGGLYIEVAPSGGKWWRYKFRFGGKELRLSLGTYPDVSLKDARARHSIERKKLSEGINPAENRKAEKAAIKLAVSNSFEMVAREWAVSYFKGKTCLLYTSPQPYRVATPNHPKGCGWLASYHHPAESTAG